VRNGVSAEYFTSGPVSSPDVTVGVAVAKRLNLPHRAGVIPHRAAGDQNLDNDAVLAQWTAASRRLLGQTDGMVTLANIANAIGHPSFSADTRNPEIAQNGNGQTIQTRIHRYES